MTINIVSFEVAGGLASSKAVRNDVVEDRLNLLIPIWIVMGLIGIFGVFVFTLLVFHIFLACKGITTY